MVFFYMNKMPKSSKSSLSSLSSKSTTKYTDDDINSLLEKWSDAKQEISDLEKKIEKYKRLAVRILSEQDADTLYGDEYQLVCKNISRTTISKRDVPNDIWSQYSRSCTYPAYYITKNK